MADDETEALREANAARRRKKDRDDLGTELGGLPNGTMRRFVFDEDNPRTPEGRGKKRADEAAMRMAEAMERWASEKVTIGGIEMTRADAQTARRRILENPEHYTRLARERGYIKPGEEDAFIRRIRRMGELEDRISRGETLSAAERDEHRRLQQSETGTDGMVIRQALEDKGLSVESNARQAEGTDVDNPDGAQSHAVRARMAASRANDLPTMREIWPGVPDLRAAFDAGKAAEPLDARPPLPSSAPAESRATDRALKITLDL
jgi:hypothetical protein